MEGAAGFGADLAAAYQRGRTRCKPPERAWSRRSARPGDRVAGRGRGSPWPWRSGVLKELESNVVRGSILKTTKRIDGRGDPRRAPDRERGRHSAAHPRLGPVHPRRDPGPGDHHPGHRPGRADDRRAGGKLQAELHAALQLPALFGRRDQLPAGRRGGARSAMASWPGAR